MLDDIFDFVISESRDRGVLYAHETWLLISLILFFIFAIILNLLIPTKKTERNQQPPLLPCSLVRRSHKKISHYCHDGNRHSRPSWLKFLLQQPILAVAAAPMGAPPPSNNACLFDCCQGPGGGCLASCTSQDTARTMWKLKNNIQSNISAQSLIFHSCLDY